MVAHARELVIERRKTPADRLPFVGPARLLDMLCDRGQAAGPHRAARPFDAVRYALYLGEITRSDRVSQPHCILVENAPEVRQDLAFKRHISAADLLQHGWIDDERVVSILISGVHISCYSR